MILKKLEIRKDKLGDGSYGAKRANHNHQGVDYLVQEGESIFSPEPGTLIRYSYPYESDHNYKGLLFKGNSGTEYKFFYVIPTLLIGQTVAQGKIIATAQAISKKYGSAMKDHIHVEVRKNNNLLDPAKFFITKNKFPILLTAIVFMAGLLSLTNNKNGRL